MTMGKTILFAMLLASLIPACGSQTSQESTTVGVSRTTRHCHVQGALQDSSCTPGDVETTDMKIVCGETTSGRRNVPKAVHKQVFLDYGIDYPAPEGAYEVDHLISLELGGSNDIKNLWPEAADPKPGFHEKDKVENELHRKVCAGEMSLEDAQQGIAKNWLSYQH